MPPDSLASHICPWLGLKWDPHTKHGYPSQGNTCFASKRPRHLSFSHQAQYCLEIQFDTCVYFPQPETESQDSRRKKSRVKIFLFLSLTLFVIAFLALGITFLMGNNLFFSSAAPLLSSATLTPNAMAITSTLASMVAVALPTSSPTAITIPSTATNVPTPSATIAVPSPSSTATLISNTATPVIPTATVAASPTKPPAIALRYPAVTLLEPRYGQQVNSETATFEWQDTRPETGDHYELWLKRLGSSTWEKRYSIGGGKFVLSYRDAMDYGDYVWSVLILDTLGQVVSPIGEERKLIWRPRDAPTQQDSSPSSSSPFIKP